MLAQKEMSKKRASAVPLKMAYYLSKMAVQNYVKCDRLRRVPKRRTAVSVDVGGLS